VLGGQALKAAAGRLLGGYRPYGYRAEYEAVCEPGRPPKLVPVRLVPDGHKADVVRWLFERYASGTVTLMDLVRELNERGAPPPARPTARKDRRGLPRRWTHQAVSAILRNPRYTGCVVWNRTSRGKYHGLVAGRPDAPARGGRRVNDRADWTVVEGRHEPLVSRETFDRVQDRLRANRGGGPRTSRRGYLLSGLLVCEHCGRTLRGATVRRHGR
jgi:hypothetical protein